MPERDESMGVKSEAEILFAKHLRELGLLYKQEVKFHPERKWRFDFVLCQENQDGDLCHIGIAIEIEGGIWACGRHTRGSGYQGDLEKYNRAVMLGYRVLRFSSSDVKTGAAKAFLAEWLGKAE